MPSNSVASPPADGNETALQNEVQKARESGLFPFDSRSLAQLAVGSSAVIATLLSVPDGIALIPSATSIINWSLSLIGNWVIGAVLWFVGFGALVQLLRIVSRGVIAGASGVKLSRFDRLIAWDDIQAISLEPNQFFTRIFSLKVPARRLTILFRFTSKNKLLANLLFPNFVPSFFFSRPMFDALVRNVFDKSGIMATTSLPAELDDNYAVTVFRPEQFGTVRNTSSWLNKQRVLVTVIVAFSLVSFLGRKAAVHYTYNSGQKAYRQGRLDKARDDYALAVRFDPTFAAGWNGLAQSEFHLAEINLTSFDPARKAWTTALLVKPDYVEPRLGLARLAFFRRHFAEASDHLEHAVGIAPQNALAILEHAEFAIRYGRPTAGLKEARLILSQGAAGTGSVPAEYLFLAHCLVAQAKIDLGDLPGASAELASYSLDPADYSRGENVTYMMIVKSRLLTAQKSYKDAAAVAAMAVRRQPRNEEALVQAAIAAVDREDFNQADSYLARARALYVSDPWIALTEAAEHEANGEATAALKSYANALAIVDDSQDAMALKAACERLTALKAGLGRATEVRSEKLDAQGQALADKLIASARRRALLKNPQAFKQS